MNEVFELKRFVLLLRNLAQGRLKYVLLLPFLIILVQVVMFLNELYKETGIGDLGNRRFIRVDAENFFYPGYMIGMWVVTILFASVYQLYHKNKASFIQLPASVFEKWLAVVLYVLIPFTVLYVLLFLGFESFQLSMVASYKQQYVGELDLMHNSFSDYSYRILCFITVVCAMAAFLLCATTYFKKAPMLFALLLLVLIGFAGYYVNFGFAKMLVTDGLIVKSAVPFLQAVLIDPTKAGLHQPFARTVFDMQHHKPLFYFLVHPLLLIGLLWVYYYRIKESEA